MPKIKVNGKEMECPPGKRLLHFLTDEGITVPSYCWHPGLSPAGNCRMCLVKVSTSRKLEVSCMILPSEGMEVWTEGPEVTAGREAVLEYMLINHPLDCPICDKAGECTLQNHTYDYRHGVSRFEEPKVTKHTKDLGPTIRIWGNRCISCTRCVRFCDEVTGTGELSIVNRGDHSVADTHPEVPLDNPMSLCTVDICPVGALIDKSFLFQARVWFAERKDSVCTSCSRGCSVTATVYKGEVKRLQPRFNADVNGHWMCDAGRLNIGHTTSPDRLREAKGSVNGLLQALREGKVAIVASTSHTFEELYLVKQLAGALNARVGILTKDVGSRWVAKSGFTIEADKTSNRRGAELVFGSLPSVVHVARAIWDAEVRTLLVLNQIPDLEWPEELIGAVNKPNVVALADYGQSPIVAAADIIVPTATWAEKDGVVMNQDGRFQRLRTLVAPPVGTRSDLTLLQELLVGLGARKAVVSAEAIFREATAGLGNLDYAKVGALGATLERPGASSAHSSPLPVNK